ncbi:YraN family protein [Coralloluteibacterium thermophilus]|uniref:UPF0102 protein ACFO3Q_14240 n=1 Tax=Coralloluteibacterium thermophilum TaxID=2707049 RepID=A0ABV9NLT4_9GAMM
MTTSPTSEGTRAEAAARRHLEAAGLRTLATNFGVRGGEIDLVMRDGDTVVFVEVRYRRGSAFGGAAASIDLRKRRRIALAARHFLAADRRLAEAPCRFDVLALEGAPDAPQVRWLRDAFRMDELF